MLRTVNVALEFHTLLMNTPQLAEGENLESAAVCKDVSVPVTEVVKPVEGLQNFHTGPQIEMIRVPQNQVVSYLGYIVVMDALYRAVGSHRHECRSLYNSVGKSYLPCPGLARSILMLELENPCHNHCLLRKAPINVVSTIITMNGIRVPH